MTGTGQRPVKVVVTGLGATTPLGGNVAGTWEALLRGENGISVVEQEPWADMVPTTLAGRVRAEPGDGLEPIQRRRLVRSALLAVTAADEAWRDAGLDDADVDPRRVGVAVSTAMGDMGVVVDAWETLKGRGWKRIAPLSVPQSMGNSAASAVAMRLNARAGVHATVNACSSGTQALATALEMIRRGLADVMVAGGAEAPLHPLVISSFGAMRALSQRADDAAAACRPFDAGRDGMVLGEGAGVLVVESEEHALRRGARIYAEIAGVGISSDAYHIVQPEPNGAGSAAAIRASLADAGVEPEQVVHLNANGTATVPGDAAEARAVRAVFGAPGSGRGQGPVITANKSMLGHSLGAAGAVESIVTVLSVYHAIVPPTRNFACPDEGVSIDVVHGAPRKLDGGEIVAVKNSAGFGGHNVALTFRGVASRVPG